MGGVAAMGWFEEGSDNVFADLELPDPDERLVKADLVMCIVDRLRVSGMTQDDMALLMGVEPRQVSRLLVGQLSGFSTDQLRRFVVLLG